MTTSDTFARDGLPPRDLWPEMDFSTLPELAYPPRLNCATELLDGALARGWGERVAIRAPGVEWSYRELLARANRVARVLVEDLGVAPGSRVLLRGPNNPMMAACWFGAVKAGAVVVCTMPMLRAKEIGTLIEKARIGLALSDSQVIDECRAAAAGHPALQRIVGFSATGVSDGESARGTLEDMMRGKPDHFDAVDTSADDVVLIAFTSGTTGEPKGTMHFHRDVLAITDCFPRSILRPDPDDIFCGSPPLAFTFGLGGLLLFPLRYGASALLLEQAAPPHLVKGIEAHRATICFTAPTAYRAMAGLAAGHDLSSLRKCVSAGEHLPRATFELWERTTGIRIIDGIGSTEMLHIFISASGDEIRPGATGRAIPGYSARIVDDVGRELPPGTVGHLAVRGPTGCRYLHDVERQRDYVREGWNYPGDSYRMDEDGYFWYQARTDDLIVSSGYKISGPEVENALLEHPAVAECAVVGLPDEERGHVVTAFVVVRGDPPSENEAQPLILELQEFVKAQIAPYKYPRRIEFVAALPRTQTGKLQRFRLRRGHGAAGGSHSEDGSGVGAGGA